MGDKSGKFLAQDFECKNPFGQIQELIYLGTLKNHLYEKTTISILSSVAVDIIFSGYLAEII